MKKLICMFAACLLCVPLSAEVIDEVAFEEDDPGGISTDPFRSGRLEIQPIMSVSFTRGGSAVYRAGMSFGYSLSRSNQVGGTFVLGNGTYDRANPRPVVDLNQGGTVVVGPRSTYSLEEGFGSSLTGFYRFNAPFTIAKKTYPYVELFGGRDFGWGNLGELGAGVGVRKFVGRRTALTTQYSFTTLFDDGSHIRRHVITGGMSVMFR